MRSERRTWRAGALAALTAMLLFAFAVVKSDLMRLPAPAAAIPCAGVHAGPAAAPVGRHRPMPGHSACALCDLAAHLPLLPTALAVPVPLALAWASRAPVALPGARAPPSFRPRARAPPRS